MFPRLHKDPYVFMTSKKGFSAKISAGAVMTFKENEGITLIIERDKASVVQKKNQDTWAMITLQVHSDLNAVGFLAALTQKLAEAKIPVNAVSAFHHDHIFVPWARRHEAMKILRSFRV